MTDSNPPKAMHGVSLRVLSKIDGPIEGYETVMVELQIPAGTLVGRHSHPGLESTYVTGGSGELTVDGQDGRLIEAGDILLGYLIGNIIRLPNGERDDIVNVGFAAELEVNWLRSEIVTQTAPLVTRRRREAKRSPVHRVLSQFPTIQI